MCVFKETKNLNLNVLNMITGINKLKILTKYISCKCRCKMNSRKFNSNQMWNKINIGVNVKFQQNIICAKNICI